MKVTRWTLSLALTALGALAAVLVFLENGTAGVITAFLVLLCVVPLLLSARAVGKSLSVDPLNAASNPNIGVTAMALRQGRAIARLDDGEITGAEGRSV